MKPKNVISNLAHISWQTRITAALLMLLILGANPCLAADKGTSFGINLEASWYYNCDAMYVDLFRHSGGWFNYSTGVKLNSDGMLASGGAQNLICTGGYQSGDLLFYGEGDFTITFTGVTDWAYPNGGIKPGTLKTVNNVTTAVVPYVNWGPQAITDGPVSQNEILVGLTVNDPNNPPKNFHLIAPGYPAYPNTNATFTKEFLQAMAPFSTYRMMDWMNTNGSTVTTWASRPQPGVFAYANDGSAYERFIELANLENRDLWINIPVNATDDWATNMAQLLKTTLNPGLHVYIEFSNEVWNFDFPQWGIVETWDQTNSALTSPTGWARHGEELAFLTMHFYELMQPIMGSQARFLLCGQVNNTPVMNAALTWIQQNYGPPSNFLYGVASAPYFGGGGSAAAGLFTSINGNINNLASVIKIDAALAHQYNLNYCCYESGSGLDSSSSDFALNLAAQTDPRMGTAYTNYAAVMNGAGVTLCNFFNSINPWPYNGFWGVDYDVRHITAGTSVKYAAESTAAKNGTQNSGAVATSTPSKSSSAAAAKAAAKAKELAAKEAAAKAKAAAEAAKKKKHG
jgi:hypothetical protein